MEIYKELIKIAGEGNVLTDEPMRRHTTFKIGGPADFLVSPADAGQIKELASLCLNEDIPYYILGNGSNLLVGDKGYRGVIIRLSKNMDNIRVEKEKITAQAGASLFRIAAKALKASLTGFEFASGIPGTAGGAVLMNAGAYGREMKDVAESALVLTREGRIKRLSARELKFGYRSSVIAQEKYIVLEADISLEKGDADKIRAYMEELKERRTAKQPLDIPSAGSTFKRPPGNFAGKLIDEAGLRGFKVGGAKVSEKHCGFVVNEGGASAEDVLKLIGIVADRVEEFSGIRLEPEVRMIGEF